MNEYFLNDWGRSGENNSLHSVAIHRVDKVIETVKSEKDLPIYNDFNMPPVTQDELFDAIRLTEAEEVFYAKTYDKAYALAEKAVYKDYKGEVVMEMGYITEND